jgi:hypothetical protein
MPLRLKAGRTAELEAADAAKKGLKVAPREVFFDEDEELLQKERKPQ